MPDHIVAIAALAAKYNNDPTRLLDMLLTIQEQKRCVSDADARQLAQELGLSWADIEQAVSFYHFLSQKPCGQYTVYLNNGPVAIMQGYEEVAAAFSEAAGCSFGSVTADGHIGLFTTADIGMGDQEVAALINGRVFTCLTPEKTRILVKAMQEGVAVQDISIKDTEEGDRKYGDGNNAHPSIRSMVRNNIRKTGPVCLGPYQPGTALRKCVAQTPETVLSEIKASKLRGRGGAGFPTGLKWAFCAQAQGPHRCVVANADEGEPGTFKDRVLLTERAQLLFEGMSICAYAVGATTGALYLRGEYTYLKEYLEEVLEQMRSENLLGQDIAGKAGFVFDIRIQLGAGSYVCGEESALLESAEGKRGEPRNRPPFPAQSGYRAMPTVIDNVETLTSAAQIIDKGAAWFTNMGTEESTGTKVLSISGDCGRPGIYEVEFGITVGELLDMARAQDPQAIQVGGPSGRCLNVATKDILETVISFEDCPSAGAILVIGKQHDLLAIIDNFMEFFTDESCGSCAPCRAGTWLLRNTLKRIRQGQGTAEDLTSMRQLSTVMQKTTKCGLGHTAPHPILDTMDNFPHLYDTLIAQDNDIRPFDLESAVTAANAAVGRVSVHKDLKEEQA